MKEIQILRYLSKGKILILIFAILGAFSVYLFANSQQAYTATTVIRYSNGAIDKGLTPNGSELDVSEIYSSIVIKGAIEDLRLNCSVDEVRSKVKVEPIISDEEEAKKAALIEKGEEYSYFPTDYKITYEADSEKSLDYAGKMLDAIIQNYYVFYSEKYIDQLILPNNASNIAANDYDYIECAEILQQSVKDIDNYLLSKKSNYPDFRASSTGYSFEDLENIYSYINKNKVPHIYADILENKYTKDNDLLLKALKNKINLIDIELQNCEEKSEKLKRLIDNYSTKNIHTQRIESGEDGDASIIMDVDENRVRGVDVVTTYDDLLQEYVSINEKIKYNEIDKAHSEYILSIFADNRQNRVLSSKVEQDVEDLVKTLNKEYSIVKLTAKELNEYIGASYLNILNSVVTAQKVNIKIYLALALVFFLFFGCAGAIVIGRLNDFIQYIIYTDKVTKLPNRQMCDIKINNYGEKELDKQFTCVIISLDSLRKTNETLGRSAGDILMRDFGEILKSVARNYGFIGWNQGSFIGLFERCSKDKTDFFMNMLKKRVDDYNDKQLEMEIRYTACYSNTSEDEISDIHDLIRKANDRLYTKK